ncbi:hypothetical protein [Hyphomicrobium sulfonivorans]|nr:hypothetical protein [Hyphomicrobium sulfonivorans]
MNTLHVHTGITANVNIMVQEFIRQAAGYNIRGNLHRGGHRAD